MTGDDVPNDEMPNVLRPERGDMIPLSDAALGALLAGTQPPAEPAPELQPIADLLAALRAAPTSGELAGANRVLAEFRRGTAVRRPLRRSRRRPRVPAFRPGTKAAAAVGIAALTLGGVAAAAFAGMLSAPVQRIAHEAIGGSATSSGTQVTARVHQAKPRVPASPRASDPAAGPAVPRPCAGYARARAYGSFAQRAAAFGELVRAARGAGGAAAYCGETMPRPGGRGTRPPSHLGKRVPPGEQGNKGQRHNRVPRGGRGRRIPPGERRGHHGRHSNDKPGAHRSGRRGQRHPPHGSGRAHQNPARHRAVTRSQLGRVGPRHRSAGQTVVAVRWAGPAISGPPQSRRVQPVRARNSASSVSDRSRRQWCSRR